VTLLYEYAPAGDEQASRIVGIYSTKTTAVENARNVFEERSNCFENGTFTE
jgi:hypothetical protein